MLECCLSELEGVGSVLEYLEGVGVC